MVLDENRLVPGGIRMKKALVVLLFAFLFFLAGCTAEPAEVPYGSYDLSECVYVHPLSSATKEYLTEQSHGIVSVDLAQTEMKVESSVAGITDRFTSLSYVSVSPSEGLDAFNIGLLEEFLGEVQVRYDLIQDDEFTGYSLFLGEDGVYWGEIRTMGEDETPVIWVLYELTTL